MASLIHPRISCENLFSRYLRLRNAKNSGPRAKEQLKRKALFRRWCKFFFLIPIGAFAASMSAILLLDSASKPEKLSGIVYDKSARERCYGDLSLCSTSSKVVSPVVILVHRNGQECAADLARSATVTNALLNSGFNVFDISAHAFSLNSSEQLEDVQHAITFLQNRASKYHLDTQAISLIGVSELQALKCVPYSRNSILKALDDLFKIDKSSDKNAHAIQIKEAFN